RPSWSMIPGSRRCRSRAYSRLMRRTSPKRWPPCTDCASRRKGTRCTSSADRRVIFLCPDRVGFAAALRLLSCEPMGWAPVGDFMYSRTLAMLAVSASTLVLATQVQAQALYSFDLPAQPLETSLRAVAAQTDTNVVFSGELLRGKA